MPRTGFKGSPTLRIEIDDQQPIYLPGDSLSGYVISDTGSSKLPDSLATIQLGLFGRAKTKYVIKRQQGTSIYRGRAVFIQIRKILHRGSICETGQHAWPFSITIPEHPTPNFASRGDDFDPAAGFLWTKDSRTKQETDVSKHRLPTIMYYFDHSSWSGKKIEAYIEYVLFAESTRAKASVPLYVRRRSVPSPITDYAMQLRSFSQETKTLKLLPEYSENSPPVGTKLKSMLRPSKTPKYSYSVMVAYPATIQLEHPKPLPFKIYLVPNVDPQRTTISADNGKLDGLPNVTITSMEVKLNSYLHIRCPGSFSEHDATKHHTCVVGGRGVTTPIIVPVIQSPDSKPDQSEKVTAIVSTNPFTTSSKEATIPSSALDLGTHFSLFLGARSLKREVFPTFSTYNIFVSHTLGWKINFACAGETHGVSGEPQVTVLPPSEEQEEIKKRQLGKDGMKKSHDELEAGVDVALNVVGQIVQSLS